MEVVLILTLACLTYFTRTLGHLVVSRFGALHPRVLAALNAVPAAVIITIVIPSIINGGIAERVALAVAVLCGLRMSMIPTVMIGLAALVVLRAMNP